MNLHDIRNYKKIMEQEERLYYTDLFTKAIWGDMGDDSASVEITVQEGEWFLHYIRTQSGEPYPLSPTVCNLIDEYTKCISDSELYDFLTLHQKLQEFASFFTSNK